MGQKALRAKYSHPHREDLLRGIRGTSIPVVVTTADVQWEEGSRSPVARSDQGPLGPQRAELRSRARGDDDHREGDDSPRRVE